MKQDNHYPCKSRNKTTYQPKAFHFVKSNSAQGNHTNNDVNWNSKNGFKNQTMMCLNKQNDLTNTINRNFLFSPRNFASPRGIKVQPSDDGSNQLKKIISTPVPQSQIRASIEECQQKGKVGTSF
jgi:hypothetical protein